MTRARIAPVASGLAALLCFAAACAGPESMPEYEQAALSAEGTEDPDEGPWVTAATGDPTGPCGGTCRGACGAGCPDSCTTVNSCPGGDIKVTCNTHAGCREHDSCYDACNDVHGCSGFKRWECRRGCDLLCIDTYGWSNCVSWAGGGGPSDGTITYTFPCDSPPKPGEEEWELDDDPCVDPAPDALVKSASRSLEVAALESVEAAKACEAAAEQLATP